MLGETEHWRAEVNDQTEQQVDGEEFGDNWLDEHAIELQGNVHGEACSKQTTIRNKESAAR